VRGKPLENEQLRHRARFVLRRAGTVAAAPRIDIPAHEGTVHARSFFHTLKEPLALGPLYTRTEWILVRERSVTGTVRPPRQRDMIRTTSCPLFQLDPLLVDAALQVAANWDGYRHRFVSLPIAVAQLSLGRSRSRSEHARVHAEITSVEGTDVFADVLVAGENGELLMELQGAHLRRVAQIE
jgi:hypothetical protein